MEHVYVHRRLSEQTNTIKVPVGGVTKRLLDLFLASATIILTLPMIILVGIAMKLVDPGPLLSRQARVGYRGGRFTCLEFRTTPVHAPDVGAAFAADREDRETGRHSTGLRQFLRLSSIYKLPQLINVLRGDMSLIGPYPMRPADLARYGDRLELYLSARPGMASVSRIRGGKYYLSEAKRVALDTDYVREWRFSTDLAILLRAAASVIERT